jgi:hypothetical protein
MTSAGEVATETKNSTLAAAWSFELVAEDGFVTCCVDSVTADAVRVNRASIVTQGKILFLDILHGRNVS